MAIESPLPSAFEALPHLLGAAGRPSVFLDYDGTLTPIVLRPEMATLAPTMRAALARLAEVAEVAVITGRDVDDALRLLGLPGVTVAGSHGFEVARPNGHRVVLGGGDSYRPALASAEREVERHLPRVDGARLERKRFALALHYREVPVARHAEVIALASEVAANHQGLRLAHGKMVVELRPDVDWDKGRVVETLLDQRREPGPVTYLGDDVTDEDAFEALGRIAGPTAAVIVGERAAGPTAARYALDDVTAVQRWLDALTEGLRSRAANEHTS